MLIFIQNPRQVENACNFTQFIHIHQLMYTDLIRVETKKGDTIYESISVADYLKEIPEL